MIARYNLDSTVEQMLEGIQILSFDLIYIYLNEAARRHGRTGEVIGVKLVDRYPGIENTTLYALILEVLKSGHLQILEHQVEYEDKSKSWFDFYIEPHAQGILIRSIDINKRKKLEEVFLHTQRIEAVGRLAGGLAHALNNKLGAMLIYSELALDSISEEQKKLRSCVQQMIRSIEQSTILTNQLLAFGCKQGLDLKTVNLNDLCENTLTSIKPLVGDIIEVKVLIEKDLNEVRVDPSQIEQVLLNLATHARDAMPKGGVLTLETANVFIDNSYCKHYPKLSPGNYMMLCVSDTGEGMTKEDLSHIFEPFYTNKSIEKGSDLGLASAHGIVNQSGGHIVVQSEVGSGTTFNMYFPAVHLSETQVPKQGAEVLSQQGSERILLVESDPFLRAAFMAGLEKVGYQVESAVDYETAEALFLKRNTEFDILLTDVLLPKSTGSALYNTLKSRKKNLKVIFVTDYINNSVASNGLSASEYTLLQKPVSTRNLLLTIRKVADNV